MPVGFSDCPAAAAHSMCVARRVKYALKSAIGTRCFPELQGLSILTEIRRSSLEEILFARPVVIDSPEFSC